MATTAAGRSTARKVTGTFPKFDLMRTIWKTLTVQPHGNFVGLWGNRWGKHWMKTMMVLGILSFPAWLLNKYCLPELASRMFAQDVERWKKTPMLFSQDPAVRAYVNTTAQITREDPWSTFVPAARALPWGQYTKYNEGDEEELWKAFGANAIAVGAGGRGLRSTYMGQQSFFTMYFDRKVHDCDTLIGYVFTMYGLALSNWAKDMNLRYGWWFDGRPVEERPESLGQRGWETRRRKVCGYGGWRAGGLFDGGWTPVNMHASSL
eukprot:TRINITY_DN1700_c0_g1_i1.p1 TRINITY_DN1700_c0_g1~~TRINITY_DN1700_c0_g1_i1.p1  ORF type:complete len:288 (+),score=73.68 TRINITY_DN1700_c0_g1_i1:75-866(+)